MSAKRTESLKVNGIVVTLSRPRPAVGADLDAGEVPGEAGVGRPLLPVVPQPEVRHGGRDDTEAVAGGVIGRERPIAAPVLGRAAPVLLTEIGLAQDLGAARIVHPRAYLHVRCIDKMDVRSEERRVGK